jgi:rhodanese-related sulfurtransferase
MKQLRVTELSRWLGRAEGDRPQLLDVRESWEIGIAQLPGSIHIPMREIPSRWRELDAKQPVVCVCHHGVRSLQVAMYLARHGFDPIYNLVGGIDAWAREVDRTCPTY